MDTLKLIPKLARMITALGFLLVLATWVDNAPLICELIGGFMIGIGTVLNWGED